MRDVLESEVYGFMGAVIAGGLEAGHTYGATERADDQRPLRRDATAGGRDLLLCTFVRLMGSILHHLRPFLAPGARFWAVFHRRGHTLISVGAQKSSLNSPDADR